MTIYTIISIEKLPAFIYTLNMLEKPYVRWSFEVSLMRRDKCNKIMVFYHEPILISYWNPLLGLGHHLPGYNKEVSISEYLLLQCC